MKEVFFHSNAQLMVAYPQKTKQMGVIMRKNYNY